MNNDTLKKFFKSCNHYASKINIQFVVEIAFLLALYFFTFQFFNSKFEIYDSKLWSEMIVMFVALIGTEFLLSGLISGETFLKDVLRFLCLLVTFLLIAFFSYKSVYLKSLYAFKASFGGYFFVVRQVIKFLFCVKTKVSEKYSHCDVILVLEDNFSSIQEDIIQNINEKYTIKGIVNLSNFNVSHFNGKVFQSLGDLEKYFNSFWRVFADVNVRKLIYIAAAPNSLRIKELLKLSVNYNMQLFRTNYLEGFANINEKSVNLIPFSFKDFETELSLSVENKHFLIAFFRNKNVWISYNGEDVIFEFIHQIAKSGVGFLNVFVNSEYSASKIDILLKNFKALSYTTNFESMEDFVNNPQSEAPDYVFYSSEVNDASFSVDNFIPILKRNFFKVKNIVDSVSKLDVTRFFYISDINNLKATNWINVTQRLSEFYIKASGNSLKTTVIRIPKTSLSFDSFEDLIMSQISCSGSINIPESFGSKYLTSSLLNILIKAINMSQKYDNNILNIIPREKEKSFEILVEMLLNIKGLELSKDVCLYDDSSNNKTQNEFKQINEKIVPTDSSDIFVLEKFSNYQLQNLNLLDARLKELMRNNLIPEIINICLAYSSKKDVNQSFIVNNSQQYKKTF